MGGLDHTGFGAERQASDTEVLSELLLQLQRTEQAVRRRLDFLPGYLQSANLELRQELVQLVSHLVHNQQLWLADMMEEAMNSGTSQNMDEHLRPKDQQQLMEQQERLRRQMEESINDPIGHRKLHDETMRVIQDREEPHLLFRERVEQARQRIIEDLERLREHVRRQEEELKRQPELETSRISYPPILRPEFKTDEEQQQEREQIRQHEEAHERVWKQEQDWGRQQELERARQAGERSDP